MSLAPRRSILVRVSRVIASPCVRSPAPASAVRRRRGRRPCRRAAGRREGRADTRSCSTSGATTAVASPDRHRQTDREHDRRALLARHAHRLERRRPSAAGVERARRAARDFPAGTVSGAPKVQAMEIIDELEPVKRGIYAGAVGYLGSTATWTWQSRSARRWSGRQLHVQAGAGMFRFRSQFGVDRDPE